MAENNKAFLIILDGWGLGDGSENDAISQAETPFFDKLMKEYPNSKLQASGENVGLPEGQMGNSEVGHLNLGAGRIVYQDLVKINRAIQNGDIENNDEIIKAYNYAKENNKNIHFLGLVSDGGVHSSDKHLYKLCDMAQGHGLENVFVHALMDGRDTDPKSGYGFLKNLKGHLEHSAGEIATVCGRYYTMDRDKRWERIKKGYDLMVHGNGKETDDVLKAVKESYDKGVTDEFIEPVVRVDDNGKPLTKIEEGDVVFCFNFRTDRLRQITIALTQQDFPDYDMHTIPLYYLTMTRYDDTFKDVKVAFKKDNVKMTMGEFLSIRGHTQLRIAETEKYAHVTFFFSGGREEAFEGEDRVLVHSPKVATYDLQPEMSAYKVTDALLPILDEKKYDFICLNYANGDMVGHTGDWEAILKAANAVDNCLSKIVPKAVENGYTPVIIADHGNADYAKNPDGSINTAHSLNPVPCIVVNKNYNDVQEGILADIAPTILKIMELTPPKEMEGKSLV